MRYLIAQGPGYYGVNIRQIDEATYERLLGKDEYAWSSSVADPTDLTNGVHCAWQDPEINGGNTTMLFMTQEVTREAPHTGNVKPSTGFDTGWWDEGERALDEVLK